MQQSSIQTLILASSSPRRQELIGSLQVPYCIRVSDVDETTEPGMKPADIVESLSLRKATAVAGQMKNEPELDGVIIGSDTIVVWNGEVLGKPVDEADAVRMLMQLQGNTHEVYSGIACLSERQGFSIVSHRVTKVTMKSLTGDQIKRYVATGEPMDKAGSYGIQGLGATIVERIEGDYFNVVGLPISLLADMLRQFGIEVL